MDRENVSYWNKTAEQRIYPSLEKNLDTEVLILGGGITGVTCAYCLAKGGMRPVLIEAETLCAGSTGNTTGKVTIQHGVIYKNLTGKYGRDAARLFAESQAEAVEFVAERVKEHAIQCQFQRNTAILFAASPGEREVVEAEYKAAAELGIHAELAENPDFPPGSLLALGYGHQAVFHPVRYVGALAAAAVALGAEIYCGTKAERLENGEAKSVFCENGVRIRAKHIVMATQYPFYDGPNLFFTRLYAKRAYAIAVKAENDWPEGAYISAGDPVRSVRSHTENGERLLIVAGESHPTGRGEADMEKHYAALEEYAGRIAGVGKVLARWSAQDYETPDQIPYIGRISENSDIYVASGFGKWGMSSGTLSGMLISEWILEGKCRFQELYSRNRSDYISSLGKTLSGVFVPVGELILSKLEGTESIVGLRRGEGRVVNFRGRKAGVYRDDNDDVTILDISCTHMGTELNFNSAEKTWDCPAHGGRFDTSGKLLEGPPKHDLKVYYRGKFSDLAIK
ncbi:Glycine/D-amino acid oxidase [Papillibacter cinnamivorans DSM 12816]|uniref:Glycine/D-amino acid oxidase n=1 Tax=Papillibacter cinnamivorans DSM 12816 TaxID=1122930 RepID=A0A1W1YDG6_9FIRM|nr:Glycine/D-amino acid oxidase [Papillibacter cinnamivorans DSM 12816]